MQAIRKLVMEIVHPRRAVVAASGGKDEDISQQFEDGAAHLLHGETLIEFKMSF